MGFECDQTGVFWEEVMKNLPLKSFLAILAFYLCLSPALADPYEDGRAAFEAGNFKLALKHWQPLAEKGHGQAQYGLGGMYEYARGFERSDENAIKWYKRAADQGVTGAQYRLGVLYENGWGLSEDDALAVIWYEKAADAGHSFAQHDLAFMYIAGTGVPKNTVQAYKWLKIAMLGGNSVMGKHLISVASTMSAPQVRDAETLAREWLEAR